MRINARWLTLPLLASALAAVSPAFAGCGDLSSLQSPYQFAATQTAELTPQSASLPRYSSGNAMNITASPIGMWNIQFISQGNSANTPSIPDGALVDFGYTQWHSDGTEIMNSGGHSPSTQNFCLGVWARTGMFTYEVNHFALSYDATSGMLVNKINIRQQVTLDPSGNEFSGTFTIDIYGVSGSQILDHIAGTIAATRVTVDQTTP